jgi:hypothetical protein
MLPDAEFIAEQSRAFRIEKTKSESLREPARRDQMNIDKTQDTVERSLLVLFKRAAL